MNTSKNRSKVKVTVILTSFILLLAVSPALGQVFSDDAERAVMEGTSAGGFGVSIGWVAVNLSITGSPSQAQVHSGKWSYAFQSGQSASWSVAYTNPDPQYLKFWFYVPSSYSLGSGSVTSLGGLQNTTGWGSYSVQMTNSGGSLYTYVAGTTGTNAITTNAWHTIEMEYNVTGRAVTVWLDGTQDIALTGQKLAAMNTVFLQVNAGTGTIYFDDITVSASASGNPTSWLYVRHAYPTNRLAMKVQTYLWGAAASDVLVSSIDGTTFSTISNPGTYQEPVLTLTTLSAGNHTLQVQLQNSGGTARQTWTETIVACGCTPTNGIDAYNNVVRGGHKLLPITPWEMNADDITLWAGWGSPSGYNLNPPGLNATGWTSQWASSYSASQYQSFLEGTVASGGLNCLNEGNFPVIGPEAGRMGPNAPWNPYAGTGSAANDATNMGLYAGALTNEPCVLGWFGYDEANYSLYPATTAQIIAGMQGTMNAAHANDNNHPFLYDDDTSPYLHLEWYYPTLVADIYSSDTYPLCYSNSLHTSGQQMSDWVRMMDRDERANYGLVPNYQILELAIYASGEYAHYNCSASNEAGTSISNTTVYNEFWMSFIHDRKGFGWYTDNNPPGSSGYGNSCTAQSTPPATECFPATATMLAGCGSTGSGCVPAIVPVVSAVTAITPDVMLANPTERTISTNQTANCVASPYTAGTRVDATYREYGGNIWIFAARLTDPLCNTSENSASALSTTITVSGLSGSATATVYGESRTVPVANGVLTDSFSPWAVHIYEIPSDPPGVPTSPSITGVKIN